MPDNTSDQKKNNFKKLFWIILIITISIFLFITIEKTLFFVCKIFYFDYLVTLVFLFLHVLLVRYCVRAAIFPGCSTMIQKLVRYEHGR